MHELNCIVAMLIMSWYCMIDVSTVFIKLFGTFGKISFEDKTDNQEGADWLY